VPQCICSLQHTARQLPFAIMQMKGMNLVGFTPQSASRTKRPERQPQTNAGGSHKKSDAPWTTREPHSRRMQKTAPGQKSSRQHSTMSLLTPAEPARHANHQTSTVIGRAMRYKHENTRIRSLRCSANVSEERIERCQRLANHQEEKQEHAF